MKIKLLVVATVIVMAGSATAQSAFDGFNAQLGIGGIQSQVNTTGTEDTSITPNASINGTSSATRLNGMASIGYSQSFDNLFKGFNLAGNIFYVIGNQSAGNVSTSTTGKMIGIYLLLKGKERNLRKNHIRARKVEPNPSILLIPMEWKQTWK